MSSEDAPQIIERRRVNLPAVDVSSHQWWEAQHDVSLSIRMLIRAEIERNVTRTSRTDRSRSSHGGPTPGDGGGHRRRTR